MKPQECNNAFEFKHTNSDGRVVTMTFEADTWPEVLENFIDFLRGSAWDYLTNQSVGINKELHPLAEYSWRGKMFYPNEVNDVKHWCETCEGSGKVHEEYQIGCPSAGGEFPCPDCDGKGYYTLTPDEESQEAYQIGCND
jgi:hypothetical protein